MKHPPLVNSPSKEIHNPRRWIPALGLITVVLLSCTCTDFLPVPPTQPPGGAPPTATLESLPPATSDPGPSTWDGIAGMWSGCPQTAGAGIFAEPCALQPGGYPLGNFLTMYLLPTCSIGDMCGSYVKGRFDSEFILFHLTLVDIIGDTVYMYGEPSAEMFAGMEMDVEISRAGPNLSVVESNGESYTIPPGCDPVISDAFRCWDTVP